MALGVLAYPVLNPEDYERIQDFRKEHDELYYAVAEPHLAFVFPVDGMGREAFSAEIEKKARGIGAIDFEIKCATINKDAFLDYYHMLLVPDKGCSDIVKLHDRLYSELFFKHLRLDIDFIPHMGIANSKDPLKVKKWVDSWNSRDFSIVGTIEKLTIVDYTDFVLTNVKEVKLV
jgi:hypothetical protein